jgi:predicted nucleic acid-binding protein
MRTLAAKGEDLLTHSYVLLETFALLHRRQGLDAAVRVDGLARSFEIVAVDRALHERAVDRLRVLRVSLVDAVSFEVMRDRGLRTAFAFDADFEAEGFRLPPP